MTKASTRFVRASQLAGRPVVTLAGDHEHDLQDLLLDRADSRSVEALTLREPGLLGRRHRSTVPIGSVRALGPDAVMIDADASFDEPDDRIGVRETVEGIRVLTDAGAELGTVLDAVIETHDDRVRLAAVELRMHAAQPSDGPRYLALPHELVLSGEALVVPADVESRLCTSPNDLADAVADAHGGW